VLERSNLGVCKQGNYRWSDMGTWNALWEYHKRDENRNAVMGPATLHDCKGSLVIS
jgi:mannose-1-phosphate guanylyltransferase